MDSINKVWHNKKILIDKLLKIYKTTVKSVLIYNMNTDTCKSSSRWTGPRFGNEKERWQDLNTFWENGFK